LQKRGVVSRKTAGCPEGYVMLRGRNGTGEGREIIREAEKPHVAKKRQPLSKEMRSCSEERAREN